MHNLVLEADTVSNQLALEAEKPALLIRGLEATKEVEKTQLLLNPPGLTQDQGLVSTAEVLDQNLTEDLRVQPAGVRDTEEENRFLPDDVLLDSEANGPCSSLRCVHISTIRVCESRINCEGLVKV